MNTESIRAFREKLAAGPVFGPFSKTADPAFAEIMAGAGFDFVIIDLEHGPNSILNAHNLIRAVELGGALPIVRTAEGAEWEIGAALDGGAGGVQIPHVSTAEDAEAMVRHARFSPMGQRGMCRYVRAAQYSMQEKSSYLTEANEPLLVVQVEGREGLENLETIVSVQGIDIVFIGPYDLSQSLGVPGEVDHTSVVEAVSAAADTGARHGVAIGTFVDTVESGIRWAERGVRYVSYAVDVGIFASACGDAVAKFRSGV